MQLRPISADEAAQALQGMAEADPRGLMQPQDIAGMCRAGQCVEVEHEGGRAVIVLTERNGVLWINAAAGAGPVCMTSVITQALDASGARSIAFQTARPGLVRKAKRLGYRVTGYIMRRDK